MPQFNQPESTLPPNKKICTQRLQPISNSKTVSTNKSDNPTGSQMAPLQNRVTQGTSKVIIAHEFDRQSTSTCQLNLAVHSERLLECAKDVVSRDVIQELMPESGMLHFSQPESSSPPVKKIPTQPYHSVRKSKSVGTSKFIKPTAIQKAVLKECMKQGTSEIIIAHNESDHLYASTSPQPK